MVHSLQNYASFFNIFFVLAGVSIDVSNKPYYIEKNCKY